MEVYVWIKFIGNSVIEDVDVKVFANASDAWNYADMNGGIIREVEVD